MKESTLVNAARNRLITGCPGAVIKKLNDRSTEGIPDTVVTWSDHTSWLEFKHLTTEPLHSRGSSGKGLKKTQLMHLIALERQEHRAWVVVYRSGKHKCLQIFRPSALLRMTPSGPEYVEPAAESPSTLTSLAVDLSRTGVAQLPGHNHEALVALLHLTHKEN